LRVSKVDMLYDMCLSPPGTKCGLRYLTL